MQTPKLLFSAFCFIVFSKIVWYDLRVYWPAAEHRDVTTAGFMVWIILQLIVYGVAFRPIARETRRNWRPLAIWVGLVSPYFLIGALQGRFGLFYVGDIARYGLALGFFLGFSLALRLLGRRTTIQAVVASLATCIVIRTVVHLTLGAPGQIRYGVPWEVFLLLFVVAGAMVLEGRRLWAALTVIALLCTIFTLGLSRSILLGSFLGTLVTAALIATRTRVPKRKIALVTSFASAAAIIPLVFPTYAMRRLDITAALTSTDFGLLAEAASDFLADPPPQEAPPPRQSEPGDSLPLISRSSPATPAPPPPDEEPGTARVSPPPAARGAPATDGGGANIAGEARSPGAQLEAQASAEQGRRAIAEAAATQEESTPQAPSLQALSRLDHARSRWETSIGSGGRSMSTRIAESAYFLEELHASPSLLLFGVGAGWSVNLDLRFGSRIVRGAHNTFLTLLFRHGLVLGSLLVLIVVCYGLRANLAAIEPSPQWSAVFLIALVAYRVAAVTMANLHQGLIDDPLVFLSIAAATTPQRNYGEGPGPSDS